MPCSSKNLFFTVLTVIFLSACGGEPEDTRPGQPVKTRQMAFKEFIKTFEPMGTMLRTQRYDADKFLALAQELNGKREVPWAHFGPDTQYPPSKATPEVWSNSGRFEQEKQDFLNRVAVLLQAAESRDEQQARTAHKAVYERCQSCHQTFKRR